MSYRITLTKIYFNFDASQEHNTYLLEETQISNMVLIFKYVIFFKKNVVKTCKISEGKMQFFF